MDQPQSLGSRHHLARARGLDDRRHRSTVSTGVPREELHRVPEPPRHQVEAAAGRPRAPHLQLVRRRGRQQNDASEGTQIGTPQAADEDAVTFETTRDLHITKTKLDRCYSYWNETYSDNSNYIKGGHENGFEAFGGAERIERFLYLGDSRFAGLGDEAVLRIFLSCPDHGGRDMARLLEWEYWNGSRWKEFITAPVEVERGEVCFRGPAELKPVAVHGIEDLWVRGRLAEVPQNPQETEVDTVRVRIEVIGEGVAPDRAFANLENNAFIGLDLGKNMWPFGKEPKPDCALHVACRELLRTAGAEVRIEFSLADTAVIPVGQASEDLTIGWEYWDGRKWRLLGKAGPKGPRPGGSDEFGFRDETACLTKSGVVSFYRPKDLQPGEVNGEENYWIRARIELGNYGRPGTYSLENDKWIWKDEKPLRPPALRAIAFKYREEYKEARHVVAYNDFRYRDLTDEAKTEYYHLPAVRGGPRGVADAVPRLRREAPEHRLLALFPDGGEPHRRG